MLCAVDVLPGVFNMGVRGARWQAGLEIRPGVHAVCLSCCAGPLPPSVVVTKEAGGAHPLMRYLALPRRPAEGAGPRAERGVCAERARRAAVRRGCAPGVRGRQVPGVLPGRHGVRLCGPGRRQRPYAPQVRARPSRGAYGQPVTGLLCRASAPLQANDHRLRLALVQSNGGPRHKDCLPGRRRHGGFK